MATTHVFVVTHGDKLSDPNPGMTPEGFEQVRALRHLLPENPPAVVVGTGRRHLDVAKALNLTPTRYTAVVGGPDSLEVVNGWKRVILLADGSKVDPLLYTTLADDNRAMRDILCLLPDYSVVCAGRPSIIMLGKADAKSAAVYAVHCKNCEIISIKEVAAIGESENGTV